MCRIAAYLNLIHSSWIISLTILLAGCAPLALPADPPTDTELIAVSDRAASLESLLRYVPDRTEYREYLTFGDYDAWLRSWAVDRPNDLDDVSQMGEAASKLWKFRMTAQTTPVAAFYMAYLAAEDMRETHGFSFFDAHSYLEAGTPPQVLTVVTQNRNRSDIEEALTNFGDESAALNEDTVLYSIAIQDDTLIIAGGASIVELPELRLPEPGMILSHWPMRRNIVDFCNRWMRLN